MHPSGDNLSVLLFCISIVLATTIAAIQSSGRTRGGFAVAAVVSGLGTIGVWIDPGEFRWSVILPFANAAVAPSTVLIAALMVRNITKAFSAQVGEVIKEAKTSPPLTSPPQPRQQPARPAPVDPTAAYKSKTKSPFEPDTEVDEAVSYLTSGASVWADNTGRRSTAAAVSALKKALSDGQITGWARLHPDAEEFQVNTNEWVFAKELRPDGYARLSNVAIYKVRVSSAQVSAAWPKR